MPAEVDRTWLPSPPWNISKRDAPAPMEPLGGQFAIRTDLKGNYLTAVLGGGKTTDGIHTDAINPLAWEEFSFWVDSAKKHYAFQTVTGNFITAVDGGRGTTDTIHSDATAISTWEMFELLALSPFRTSPFRRSKRVLSDGCRRRRAQQRGHDSYRCLKGVRVGAIQHCQTPRLRNGIDVWDCFSF